LQKNQENGGLIMKKEYGHQFDLPALLKSGDLDIQLVAKQNPSLRVEEYYDLLSEFINDVPEAADIINRIADLKARSFDFRNMSIIKRKLKTIGCHKFMQVITEIVNSGKIGHDEYAAACSKELSEEFNGIYTRIMKAEKIPGISDTDGQPGEYLAASFETFTLSKVLGLLNQEEAARKMKILAVDDSPVMLQTISSLLGKDYMVYKMVNPAMLEKFLEQVTPELFLLDYKMPGLSGFDLIPMIRNFEEHKNTPIVFLTSEGTSDHVSSAMTLGARDYIVKPFQPNILREKVAKHIVRKNLLQKKAA
jgi:CheY-like chemotaxis protein